MEQTLNSSNILSHNSETCSAWNFMTSIETFKHLKCLGPFVFKFTLLQHNGKQEFEIKECIQKVNSKETKTWLQQKNLKTMLLMGDTPLFSLTHSYSCKCTREVPGPRQIRTAVTCLTKSSYCMLLNLCSPRQQKYNNKTTTTTTTIITLTTQK